MNDDILDPPPLVTEIPAVFEPVEPLLLEPPVEVVPSNVRRLELVPRRQTPPRDPPADLVRPLRKWWRENAEDIPDKVGPFQAMSDVSVLAYAQIAKRLTDPKLSNEAKDKLAVAVGLKISIHVNKRGEGEKPPSPGPSDGRGILSAYRNGPGAS